VEHFVRFISQFFIAIFLKSLGFSGWQIGFLIAVLLTTSILSSVNFGVWSDRHSIRKMVALGFILSALYYLALSFTPSFGVMIIVFIIGGLGSNVVGIALSSLTFKNVGEEEIGKKFGVFRGITFLAVTLGMFLGGYLIEVVDFVLTFRISAVLSLLSLLLCLCIEKNKTFSFGLKKYKKDLWKKDVLVFSFVLFLFATHWGAENTSYSLYLREHLGLNLFQVGMYMGVAVIVLGIAIFLLGLQFDKGLVLGKLLGWGLFISGLGHVLMINSNVWISLFWRCFHEVGDAAVFLFLMLGINKYFPKRRVGGLAAVISVVTIAGNVFASLIYGPIGESFGYHVPIIASGISTLLILVGFKFAVKKKLVKSF